MFRAARSATIGGPVPGGWPVTARPALSIRVLVGVAVVAGCSGAPTSLTGGSAAGGSGSPVRESPSPTVAPATPTASLASRPPRPTPTPLPEYVTAVIEVGEHPGFAELAFGSV